MQENQITCPNNKNNGLLKLIVTLITEHWDYFRNILSHN